MATFRKACLKISEKGDESNEKDWCYTQTVDEDDQESSFDRTSIVSEAEEETDEEYSEADPISDQDLRTQRSVTLKEKRKAGRKSCWPDEVVNEVVNVICENELYRRRLIFTNNKASKNLELYSKVVNEVKDCLNERGKESFAFTPVQTRTKFKSCVALCKKASMTIKCGSGIENFMDQKPAWLKKFFPFVASRDSCNPSLASEPSFALAAERNAGTGETSNSRTFEDVLPNNAPRDTGLFLPTPSKRM